MISAFVAMDFALPAIIYINATAVAYSVNVSRILAVIAGVLVAVNAGLAVCVLAGVVVVAVVATVVNLLLILIITAINLLCETLFTSSNSKFFMRRRLFTSVNPNAIQLIVFI
jgi:hypothetical protein